MCGGRRLPRLCRAVLLAGGDGGLLKYHLPTAKLCVLSVAAPQLHPNRSYPCVLPVAAPSQ